MARKARFVIPGHAMHVLVHGHNQQIIFVNELDCKRYLSKSEAFKFKYCKSLALSFVFLGDWHSFSTIHSTLLDSN